MNIEKKLLIIIHNLSSKSVFGKEVSYSEVLDSLDVDIRSSHNILKILSRMHNDGLIVVSKKHSFFVIKLTDLGKSKVSGNSKVEMSSQNSKTYSQKSIFISHSSQDKEFVEKLALDLQKYKQDIWFDKWEIKVGDSIVEKINDALDKMTGLIVVLSSNSVNSNWVKVEVSAALMKKLKGKSIDLFPVLKDNCNIPPLLEPFRYADFTDNYETGISDLISAFNK